jgi:hypothetical protein
MPTRLIGADLPEAYFQFRGESPDGEPRSPLLWNSCEKRDRMCTRAHRFCELAKHEPVQRKTRLNIIFEPIAIRQPTNLTAHQQHFHLWIVSFAVFWRLAAATTS